MCVYVRDVTFYAFATTFIDANITVLLHIMVTSYAIYVHKNRKHLFSFPKISQRAVAHSAWDEGGGLYR